MKKQDILNSLNTANNKFKGKFHYISELASLLNSKKSSLLTVINDSVDDGTADMVSKTELNTKLTDFKNRLSSGYNSLLSYKNTVYDRLIGHINDAFSSSLTPLANTTYLNSKITKLDTDINTYLNSKVADLSANLNGKDVIDTKIGAVSTDLTNKINVLNTNLLKSGGFMGESDKYSTLPTKDENNIPVAEGDIAYLTKAHGGYKAGVYSYKNGEYIYIGYLIPHTEDSIFALGNLFNNDVNNPELRVAVKYANLSKVTKFKPVTFYITGNGTGENNTVDIDLNRWDMSSVTDISGLFDTNCNLLTLRPNISDWDVSNVTSMRSFLSPVKYFDSDISGWDVSKVTNMSRMLYGAVEFNRDISGWDVSKVTTMSNMLYNAKEFNKDLSGWDVSNVVDHKNFGVKTKMTADMMPKWVKFWFGDICIIAGGDNGNGYISTIERFSAYSWGNAVNHGDLTSSISRMTGCSDGTKGYFAGGKSSGGYRDDIYTVTIATDANGVSFGNLTSGKYSMGGFSNTTTALFGGGVNQNGSVTNNIDRLSHSTENWSTNFGDLIIDRSDLAGCTDGTMGLFIGGNNSAGIDKVTIATDSNATNFGSLIEARQGLGCHSNLTLGVYSGGRGGTGTITNIEQITLATDGSAVTCGKLTTGRRWTTATGDNTYAMFAGGYSGSTLTSIEHVNLITGGGSYVIGDLITAREYPASCSAS